MKNIKLEDIEKSLAQSFAGGGKKLTQPLLLDLVLFRFAKWGLVGTVTALYLLCYEWGAVTAILMAFAFAYSFAGLANLLIDAIVYLFTDPLLLPEDEAVVRDGIPAKVKVAMIRPIFARTTAEMETVLTNLRQDILANQEPGRNLKSAVIDNTRDEGVKEFTQSEIRKLQKEFGEDCVFYFHRNVKCDFFKKLGIYQDFVMFLMEGATRPKSYVGPQWTPWVKGTRNPSEPLWDIVLGDVKALGIQGATEDILAGKDVVVDANNRVELAFVSDADNLWPKGQVRKMVAKMLHPDNQEISIWQPGIEIVNPEDNGFIRLNSWARQMYGFDRIARWRLYRFSPFYGKGAMRLSPYMRDIVKKEPLHPAKAASHDFQESLHAESVLLEDAYVYEKTFSNKVSELTRGAQWLWGDMETTGQYILKPFSAGRRQHLWTLLRIIIGNPVYVLWLLGTIVTWLRGDIANASLLWMIFMGIAAVGIVVPKFFVPYASRFKKCGYVVTEIPGDSDLVTQPVFHLLSVAGYELVMATLIHFLDLVYRPIAVVQNLLKQYTGKEYVWITGAMGELQTANLTLADTYKALPISTAIGFILFLAGLFRAFPDGLTVFLLPYTVSFLLGPLAIWHTAKPTGSGTKEEGQAVSG